MRSSTGSEACGSRRFGVRANYSVTPHEFECDINKGLGYQCCQRNDSLSMSYLIVVSAILLASYVITQLLFRTEQSKIKGLPEIPGWPIVGNLLQLGSDHAAVCMKWAEKYGPVFQVRFDLYFFLGLTVAEWVLKEL